MKRCLENLAIAFALPGVLVTALMMPGAPAAAQDPGSDGSLSVRQFPKSALRGVLVVTAPPEITLNGRPDRLSSGARIRNLNNNFVVPGSLAGEKLLVNYTRDTMGQVHEVWVLTEEEAREKRAGMPSRFFSFGFGSSGAPQDDGQTPYDQLPRYHQ